MNHKSVVALALVVILAATPSAWAQGQGNGRGPDSASSNANENAGAGGNGNGNAGGNGNGNSGGNGVGQGGNSGRPDGSAGGELSESDVLAAVEAGRAVSLSTIMPDIRTRTGGEVINAQLQQVGAFLLYAVKVLTPSGKVTTEYYYARSGQHVER